MSNPKAEADELTKHYDAPLIPVLEIAARLGIKVVFTELAPGVKELSAITDFDTNKITVNQADGFERKSFAIAHEIGHIVLHGKDEQRGLPRFEATQPDDQLNLEADSFARNLLMPSRLLRQVPGALISELTMLFGVSRTDAELRVREEKTNSKPSFLPDFLSF